MSQHHTVTDSSTVRTRIYLSDEGYVVLRKACDFHTDCAEERLFSAPSSGGYVREYSNSYDHNGVQVCEFLSHRGNTLWATDDDDLLSLIRKEHARASRKAKREDYA